MPYRVLGETKERVSAIGLGGWHIGMPHIDDQLGIRIIRSAIDQGINFMDNCWDYHDGISEERMGKSAPRRIPGEGFSHDQDRRPFQKGSDTTARTMSSAAGNRLYRSCPAP